MDNSLKHEFFEYLLFMGLISKSTEETFNGIYHKLSQSNNISYVQLLSQSLTMFLSNLTFDDFYKISFDIVLRFSRNKVKAHLNPLHKTVSLFDNKTKQSIRRRFMLWNALSKSEPNEETKQCSRSKSRSIYQKGKAKNYYTTNRESNYTTNRSDFESNQNTTMNNIIRLMQANRIKNINNQSTSKRLDDKVLKKKQSYQSFVKFNTSHQKEGNNDEASFSITRIMEKCPEMSFNRDIPSSFDTCNDNNITVRTLNKPNEQETITPGKVLIEKAKKNKSNSNLIDEFYVDYLKKERQQQECYDKLIHEKDPSLSKSRKGNANTINKTKSFDSLKHSDYNMKNET